IKPPPPRLPASGYVTASVNATATAASTALPPCLKICSAASAANLSATATADAVSTTGCCATFAYAGVLSTNPTDTANTAATTLPSANERVRCSEFMDVFIAIFLLLLIGVFVISRGTASRETHSGLYHEAEFF